MEHDLPTALFYSRSLTGNVVEEEQRLAFGFFSGGFPPFLSTNQNIYGIDSYDGYLEPLPEYLELKRPKVEPLDEENTVSTIGPANRFNPVFQCLPGLQSIEFDPDLVEDYLFQLGFSCCLGLIKRCRSSSFYSSPTPYSPPPYPSFHDHYLMSVGNYPRPIPNPRPNPRPEALRLGRKRISERMNTLAGLMPWKRKMDIATMLSEAHGYVKFLQAQVTALQEMPLDCHWPVQGLGEYSGGMVESNRQQLLRVLVNSPLVQDKMYSLGVCLISVEQLVLFGR